MASLRQPWRFFYNTTPITSLSWLKTFDGFPFLRPNQTPISFLTIWSLEFIFPPYCLRDILQCTVLFLLFVLSILYFSCIGCPLPTSLVESLLLLQVMAYMVQPPGCLAWASSSMCFNSILHDMQHNRTAYTCLFTSQSLPIGYQSLEGNDGTVPWYIHRPWLNAWYRNFSFTKWKNGNFTILKLPISE